MFVFFVEMFVWCVEIQILLTFVNYNKYQLLYVCSILCIRCITHNCVHTNRICAVYFLLEYWD